MSEIQFLRIWFWLTLFCAGFALIQLGKFRRNESLADKIVRRCKEEGIVVIDGDQLFVVKK